MQATCSPDCCTHTQGAQVDIALGEGAGLKGATGAGSATHKDPTMVALQEVIDRLNDLFHPAFDQVGRLPVGARGGGDRALRVGPASGDPGDSGDEYAPVRCPPHP